VAYIKFSQGKQAMRILSLFPAKAMGFILLGRYSRGISKLIHGFSQVGETPCRQQE
jgi:hypothetical protein